MYTCIGTLTFDSPGKYWIGVGDAYGDGFLTWWDGTKYAVGDYPPDDPPRLVKDVFRDSSVLRQDYYS